MEKIIKVINDLNQDEEIFWKIESNAFITFQEGKPFSNHTKASLFNTQFLKTTITNKLIKRSMKKRSFGSSIPINIFCNLVFVRQGQIQKC